MVIDFSQINLNTPPKFILRNLDGTAIGVLGHVLNSKGKFCYNDISEIEFECPARVNNTALAEYDMLTGMRVVDLKGYGQFLLREPEEVDDGVIKKKTCKGYSLEYEFTNKIISLEEGTYNFWNPFAPESSILGIIVSEVKSWHVGYVSSDLIGKYRTFSATGKNIYDWMKSDLQKTYGCIFDFDTYNRTINVRSINDIINVKPVYLSTHNLIKELDIQEDTDSLITVLDVNGADGVSIRSVNPMGINRIYNLDAYMNESYFSVDMIQKWNQWKVTFSSYQEQYYQYIVAQNMQIVRYTTEEGALTDLEGELSALESKKAVTIQAIAIDKALESDFRNVNREISAKETEIANQKNLLTNIQNEIDGLTNKLKSINEKTAFKAFFTEDELEILDRYFKCSSLTESTFVATSTNAYAVDSSTIRGISTIFNISNINSLTKTAYGSDTTFYIINGGKIVTNASNLTLNADIVNGTLQVEKDLSFVFSLYLNSGSFNGVTFPGGTIAMTGKLTSNVTSTSNTLQFRVSSSTLYMTQDVTEYQKMSVEWELFQYGFECLQKLSSPTYYFSISSANFLALEDYVNFAKELELGEKIYLQTNSGVLCPIVTSITIDFDNLNSFEIDFGDSFSLNDAAFRLEDLLQESISMGNTLDFNQYNYSSFVNSGAKTQVKDFMTNAIDTMKNRILSGENEQITIDQAGLRCRKYNEATNTYDPKQIWLAHNALMFTSDNWNTATIGIGEFVDKNLGSIFGIIAPAIVGTILAGSQLVIESEKTDGGVAVFKVDAEGASLHNASFNLYGSTGGRIDLGAIYGIVAGANRNTLFYYDSKGQPTGVRTNKNRSITSIDALVSGETPNANFWIDMKGNAYFRGELHATKGTFSGELQAATGTFSGALQAATGTFSGSLNAASGTFKGTVQASRYLDSSGRDMMTNGKFTSDYLDVRGINVNNRFIVDENGNVTINGGSISWGTITGTSSLDQRISNAQTTANNAYSMAVGASNLGYQAIEEARNRVITQREVFNALTDNGANKGLFSTLHGELYINADYIRSGTLDANVISLSGSDGGFCTGSGRDYFNSVTYGAMMYGPNSNIYVFASSAGARLTAYSNEILATAGGCYSSVALAISSDRRIKNSISYDMDKYYSFFMKLRPTAYRMNDGNSGRFHIGFIAQDVEEAILSSKLETNDFAGFVRSSGENDVHGQFIDQCYLRYDDFIALNTYMIQKLHARIDELEAKIDNSVKV